MNIVIHYRSSIAEAQALCTELNRKRPHSAALAEADLLNPNALAPLVEQAIQPWDRLDVLVNNASTFYPTPVGAITEAHWTDLIGSNLKAPLFLAQAAAPHLAAHQGLIINLIDAHLDHPRKDHAVYNVAKAGLAMLTRALARDLAPAVRVNGVAPGVILWPEHEPGSDPEAIVKRVPLQRQGSPEDIARAVRFLIQDGAYLTGQIITVDGGLSVSD